MHNTQLYLVRHGETDWNAERRVQGQKESKLSERGVAQAMERSKRIVELDFDAVYCSSSQRTRQTVHGLLEGQVDSVHYQDNLREMLMGVWEGELRDDIDKTHPEQQKNFFENPELFELEGSETFAELQQRGVSALTDIVASHAGQRVLVVSHGAIIKATVLHYLGWPLKQMWVEPLIDNCSFSVLDYSDSGTRVSMVGDIEV